MPVTAVTLACDPFYPVIDDALVDRIMERLESVGRVERRPLAEGVAEDFVVAAPIDRARADALLRTALADAPVDIIVQPAAHRRKRLLVADMDSTIIGQECLDELADFAGLKREIAAITDRAMRGALDFEAALIERVAMLKGLPETALEETMARVTLNPGARTLIETMNRLGAVTVLVSGGFTYFVERVARMAGFARYQANELVIEDGKLTGAVKRPILGRDAKAAALRGFAADAGVPLAETLAVGDGANDLGMIEAAGLGVSFRGKPALAAAADAAIRHADLTALLYAQGLTAKDVGDSAGD